MNEMKKFGLIAVIAASAIIVTEKAYATEYSNAVVHDINKVVTTKIPHTEQVCETTKVPIYGESQMDTEGAIVGGIIGGVIGNQIGKGGGKAGATGVGAIIGSVIGGKGNDKKIIGYQNVNQCYNNTTYTTETKEVYNYSVIEFEYQGQSYKLNFKK